MLLAAFDLALLVVWANRQTRRHRAELASAAISFAGTMVLGVLSVFEHFRSIRPSILLNVCLSFTILFDIERSRSYMLDSELDPVATIFASRVGIKVFLTVFEAQGKRELLLAEYADCPKEATSGIYKRVTFWWLNELFKKGFSTAMTVDDLFHLDKHLQSKFLHQIIGTAWDRRKYLNDYSSSVRLLMPTLL